MPELLKANFEATVAIAKTAHRYDDTLAIGNALARVGEMMGWSDNRSLLGSVIPRGSRVLIKPNLVLHENQGGWGLDSLVTHPSLVRAAVEAALDSGSSEVLVGDAPVQGCDFRRLMEETGLERWARELMTGDRRFKGIEDFRRTTCTFVDGVRVAEENQVPADNFVLFDLGHESLLEPVSDDRPAFRVTCYDPRLLAKTHARGRHQYLVAKQVIDADVIINLPKLKTHKKTGVTCALKNLIGINGNKEYLPHHRVGGSKTGGDCYPGGSMVKRALEYTLDRQNKSGSFGAGRVWRELSVGLDRVSGLIGDRLGVEGSWSGNDTIWRTCLDLNRILLYGRPDASLADEPQRRVVHLVDALIAGQGDGPLAPEPLSLGLILGGNNAAAVDLTGALLLAYDPLKIPITRESFASFRWPISKSVPAGVNIKGDLGEGSALEVLANRESNPRVRHPIGWTDAALDAAGSALKPGVPPSIARHRIDEFGDA